MTLSGPSATSPVEGRVASQNPAVYTACSPGSLVYWCPRAALRKCHKLGGLNTRHALPLAVLEATSPRSR